MPTIEGAANGDTLVATANSDYVIGHNGDDTLSTGDNTAVTMHGGTGDDLYVVDWDSHSADQPFSAYIYEYHSSDPYYGIHPFGDDTLDLSSVADSVDDIRFFGSSFSDSFSGVYIYQDGDKVGTVRITGQSGTDLEIETVLVGDTAVDISGYQVSAAQLNGTLFFGATDGNDNIMGDEITPSIHGLDGNDTITLGSVGFGSALGGYGNDVLSTGVGGSGLYGHQGDDTLSHTNAETGYLGGGDGDDLYVLDWDPDTDELGSSVTIYEYADEGHDVLDISAMADSSDKLIFTQYSSNDLIINIIDDDGALVTTINLWNFYQEAYLDGQIETVLVGDDTITLSDYDSFEDLTAEHGTSYASTSGNDNIDVVGHYVRLSGQDGDDTLTGLSTSQRLDGGDGNDFIHAQGSYGTTEGGNGDDYLIGSGSGNYLNGGDGDDTLIVEGDQATVQGGAGDDLYEVTWSEVVGSGSAYFGHTLSVYDGDGGTDTLDLSAVVDSYDNVLFFPNIDTYWDQDLEIQIRDDNDDIVGTITLTNHFLGATFEYLQFGEDRIYIGGANDLDAFEAEFSRFTSNTGDSLAGDTASDILFGYGGNDTIDGNAGWDTLYGDAGTDQISGGGGNDRISGGTHADIISGDGGNDVIFGDHGADTIDGGDGTDAIQYLASGAGVTVDLSTGTGSAGQAAGDVISNIENINGSRASDHLTGDDSDNKFVGYGGWDTLEGGDGDDRLEGWAGHDLLDGGAGNDVLLGGKDNDTLNGGAGDDTLTGGTNRDVFVFEAGTGDDTVTDFNTELDTLDLSATTTDFTDTASVEAAASAVDGGVLIDLGGGDSVFLEGLSVYDIESMTLVL